MTGLVNQHGLPLRREVLTAEIAGPTLAGVRSPVGGYPADGMTPVRLATILRQADAGDPTSYFELAEQIEERDLHYLGVLGVRKRAVTQMPVTVVAASDEPADVELADMVREWLDRDELADEMFDILDASGKGDSFTEIVWDFSAGQYRPARLEWRDPRWFTYDPRDGRTPMLLGGEAGAGPAAPLPPFKFIRHTVKAKSGLPIRSGLARVAAWAWMFKAFTQRDWAIFAQTYGQPIRLGKFAPGASAADRATLWRAVANIAGDCAAIVPEGMSIDFVEAKNVQAGSELFERRADWLDRQVSKGVLGQTGTTDSKSGGLGDGGNQVHNDVRGDIKAADGKALATTLNRDLVRPWIDLERGPQARYPRIRIEEPEAEDLDLLSRSLGVLVPLGLRVQASEVRDKFGLADPEAGAELLAPAAAPTPSVLPAPGTVPGIVAGPAPPTPALQSVQPATPSPAGQAADRLAGDTEPDMRAMLGRLVLMMEQATTLGELREMVVSGFPALDASTLTDKLADAFLATRAAGLSDAADQAGS